MGYLENFLKNCYDEIAKTLSEEELRLLDTQKMHRLERAPVPYSENTSEDFSKAEEIVRCLNEYHEICARADDGRKLSEAVEEISKHFYK